MKTLWPYLRHYWGTAVIATVATIVMAFATLWQPHLLQQVMTAIIKNDRGTVMQLGLELVGLAALGIVAGVINTIFSARAALGIATDMRADLYNHIQSFAFADIEQFAASNLVVRMTNDINQVQSLVMSMFQILARVPIMFVGSIALAIVTIPSMWWLLLVMVLVMGALAAYTTTKMGKMFGHVQMLIDGINTIARENMMGVRVVKSFNQEASQQAKFGATSNEMVGVTVKIGYVFSFMMPGYFLIANLVVVGVLLIIGNAITVHPEYLATISSFVSYLMQVLIAVINASFIVNGATRAFVSLGRIHEVFGHETSMTFPDVAKQKLDGRIEFDDVTFSYPGAEDPTLTNVSFTIQAGEMVGIVGATGSGKSTLAQLIPRLFDPEHGAVRVGGVDVRQLSAASLRDSISMVLQRATLFSGTISANLRQGKTDATVGDMQWAARVAQSAEFINRLDDAFDARVEERSANFSGGQKQRLAITRGVIGKPNILIMDDSTSALDARSEHLVQEAIDRDLAGMTTVIIAEKISSVRRADRILVLDAGKIVASGTHETLLASSPIYQEIYATQHALEGGLN